MIYYENAEPLIGKPNAFGDIKTGECLFRDEIGSLFISSSYVDTVTGVTYTETYCLEDASDEIPEIISGPSENNELTEL